MSDLENEDEAGTADTKRGPGDPLSVQPFSGADAPFGYNRVSVSIHAVLALTFVAFAVTGLLPGFAALHGQAGIVLALPVLAAVLNRFMRGFPRAPDETMAVSFLDRLSMVLMLAGLAAMAASGLAVSGFDLIAPPAGAGPQGLAGWLAESPLRDWTVALHTAAGKLAVAASVFHVLAALRHLPEGKRKHLLRIARPVRGGR